MVYIGPQFGDNTVIIYALCGRTAQSLLPRIFQIGSLSDLIGIPWKIWVWGRPVQKKGKTETDFPPWSVILSCFTKIASADMFLNSLTFLICL